MPGLRRRVCAAYPQSDCGGGSTAAAPCPKVVDGVDLSVDRPISQGRADLDRPLVARGSIFVPTPWVNGAADDTSPDLSATQGRHDTLVDPRPRWARQRAGTGRGVTAAPGRRTNQRPRIERAGVCSQSRTSRDVAGSPARTSDQIERNRRRFRGRVVHDQDDSDETWTPAEPLFGDVMGEPCLDVESALRLLI